MTPVQTTPILERSHRRGPTERVRPAPSSDPLGDVECNCPEHCERDHEVD